MPGLPDDSDVVKHAAKRITPVLVWSAAYNLLWHRGHKKVDWQCVLAIGPVKVGATVYVCIEKNYSVGTLLPLTVGDNLILQLPDRKAVCESLVSSLQLFERHHPEAHSLAPSKRKSVSTCCLKWGDDDGDDAAAAILHGAGNASPALALELNKAGRAKTKKLFTLAPAKPKSKKRKHSEAALCDGVANAGSAPRDSAALEDDLGCRLQDGEENQNQNEDGPIINKYDVDDVDEM